MRQIPDQVRILQVMDNDLQSCNTATIERLFCRDTLEPSKAKILCGSVTLTAEISDRDPRPNWRIPEWRLFWAQIFKRLPHFSYFLFAAEQFYLGTVLSLLSEKEIVPVEGNGFSPNHTALVSKIVILLEPVIGFCDEIFDEADIVLNYLLQGMPENVRLDVYSQLHKRTGRRFIKNAVP